MPVGWRAPLYAISDRSPELLLDHGFVYDASLMGTTSPICCAPRRGLVELPSETANDDWTHYAHVPDLEYIMQIRAPGRRAGLPRRVRGGLPARRPLDLWQRHPSISARLSRLEVLVAMLRATCRSEATSGSRP